DIIVNESDITVNESDITVNESDITVNESDITVNESDITVNESDIIVNESDIIVNESDIIVNESDIIVNENDITVNESDIIVNESDIIVNESDIIVVRKQTSQTLTNQRIVLFTFDDVDLTPSPSTLYIYTVNYSYSQVGTFTASVLCLNRVSQDQNSSRFDTDGTLAGRGKTYTVMVDVNVRGCYASKGRYMVNMYNFKDEREQPLRGTYYTDTGFGLQYAFYQFTSSGYQMLYYGSEISAPVILSFNSTTPYVCSFIASIIDVYGYRVNYTSNIWTANSLVEIVGFAIKNFNARTPAEIQMFGNLMSKLTKDKKMMTSNSMEMASGSVLHLTNNLQRIGAKLPDLHPCLEDVTDVIQNIINYQTVDTGEFYSQARQKAVDMGLSDLETQNFIQTEYQKRQLQTFNKLEQIDNIINDVTSTWDCLLKIFHEMEDSSGKYNKSKQGYTITTQKSNVDEIREGTDFTSSLGFTFNDVDVGGDLLAPLVVRAIKSKNIFIQGSNSKLVNSDIIVASVADKKGNKLGLSSPKIIHEIGESNCSKQESLSLITPAFIEGDASEMFYHQFAYSKRLTSDLFRPCEEICLPSNTFKNTGRVFVGLKPMFNESDTKSSSRIKRRSVSNSLNDLYLFGVTTSACLSWDTTVKDWVTDNCKLTKENGNLVCSCEGGKEVISGVSFNFEPNEIHFGTVFSKFDIQAQGLVFGVFVGLYFIFVVLFFWAHYMDKKGIFQWGVFPLADNFAEDTYFYLITVHTGLRRSAGTKSNVYFSLYGQDDETDVRKLSDGIKNNFPTGSVCHFVMACPNCLGDLQCMKIWHDNSGKGSEATWYLDRIDIVDLQTGRVCYFICGEWLAAENTLETTIEATGVEDLETLKSLFISNTKERLTDDHMWLSVFIRPQNSPFSQVERVGCCFAFLFLAMITSAMFYTGVPDTNRKQPRDDFEVGPLRIGFQQLYYSFISALITAVPILIMITLFKKARRRESSTCFRKNKVKGFTEASTVIKCDEKSMKKRKHCLPWNAKLDQQIKHLEKILLIKPNAVVLRNAWPHPLRYIAWILILAAVGVSSFFVVLYSMEWGQDVTEQWLSTFFLAFLQSLFVLDPFKVIVISVLLALIVRKIKLKGLEQLDLSLVSQVNKKYGLKERRYESLIYMSQSAPLSKSALKSAILRRKISIMIKNTVKEFIVHALYLLIVNKNCTILNIKLKNCVPSFSSGKEETRDYCLGWNFQPCSEFEKVNSLSSRAWTYTPAEDIQGLPIAGNYDIYNGGGYITNMKFNTKVTLTILKELRTNYWIDHETRAVFIEFTLYSPNINNFAHIILLLEFNEMGGLIPFVSVYPVSVHNPPGLLGSFVQFCQLIGIVLTILGAIYVIFVLGKKKCSAFRDLWFLFDLSAVIIAICTATLFLLRLSYVKSALNKVKQDRNNYINFYHVVVWNSSYTLCLSLLVTIGYLRLLKLASYSEKTMKDTNVPLSDRWTTIVYFCLFVGIVVIFLTNYFLAVLMDLLVDKEKNYSKVESTKIFIVLWDSFLQVMGRKRHPTIRLKDSIKEDKSDSGDKAKRLDTDQTMLALEKNISR
ncbi:hypothetical protein Btru_073296, partial [Bulinus truncatus]